jgi:serine/threonine protein kinase
MMEDVLRPLLDRVPGISALSVTGPVASRPWSRVFHGQGSAYPTPVAIKLCLDPTTGQASPELARAYIRALASVHEAMDGHSRFASARPYALFEDLGLVVAEWVNGPTLSRLIISSPPMNARLAVRKAGAWLAQLHRSANHSFRPLNAEEMLAQLEVAMTGFRRPASASIFGRALEALHQTAPSVTGTPIVWTLVHGDFKPDNMLVSSGKLTGIDMDLRYPGPGVLDAAQFLNHLALLFRTPRGIRRLSYGNEISASFRRGYEQDGGLPLDYPQLAWVRLHNAVRLLLKHRDWSSRPVGWMTGWSLRQLIVRSTDILERSSSAAADAPRRPETPDETAAASGRIAYLEDVLTFLAEDEDTWLSPDADRLLFDALGPRAERKD